MPDLVELLSSWQDLRWTFDPAVATRAGALVHDGRLPGLDQVALDRYLYGGVVDYFSLHAFGFYWYVFNIADAAIVAGVVGLLYESYKTSRNDASNAA